MRREPAKGRREIAKAIREDFPAWNGQAGACSDCWESFRDVTRVIHFIKRLKLPKVGRGHETNAGWRTQPLPRPAKNGF